MTDDDGLIPPDRRPLGRRRVLGLAAASGAALAVGSGAATAAPRPARTTIPGTLIARGRAGAVEVPGFRVHHLGVSARGAAMSGRYRLRRDGSWGRWADLRATDSGSSRRTALIHVGDADAYEVEPGPGLSDVEVAAINTVDGPPRSDRQPVRRWRGRPYLSRAAWGADESLRFEADGSEALPSDYFPVQTLTVHHTASINTDPDPAATVRAIYAFQALPPQDFGDVGYHLLIDEAGRVYEGRWSGRDGIPVFGRRWVDGRPQMNNGAHVAGFNAGNVGVALLGEFTARRPTPAARRSLVAVLSILTRLCRLDPLAETDYVNPISGDTATVPTIAGHRDWAATECPGDSFYPDLRAVRRDVAEIVS